MPRENVELVRQATEAFSRGDFEGFLQSWAPDAVVDWSNSRGLEARVYRGHADIRAFATQFREAFEDFRSSWWTSSRSRSGPGRPEHCLPARPRRRRPSAGSSAWLITITRRPEPPLTLYQTKQEALEAVGLSE